MLLDIVKTLPKKFSWLISSRPKEVIVFNTDKKLIYRREWGGGKSPEEALKECVNEARNERK